MEGLNFTGLSFGIQVLKPNIPYFGPDAAILFGGGRFKSTYDLMPNSPDFGDLILFEETCPDNNCTSACMNSTAIFKSPYMLQNCLAYSVIAGLMTLDNLTTSGLQVANQFGILSDQQVNVTRIQDKVMGCFKKVCSINDDGTWDQDLCGIPLQVSGWDNTDLEQPIAQNVYAAERNSTLFLPNPCGAGKIENDVRGKGVVIAYIIESTLILITWAVLCFFNTWLRNTSFWFYAILNHRIIAWEQAKELQLKLRNSKHKAALLATLIEFQKAQCYFNLAVLTASILSMYQRDQNNPFRAPNGTIWEGNILLIKALANASAVPTAFGQYLLFKNETYSWYVLTLTSITMILAGVARYSSPMKPAPIVAGNYCGGNVSPLWQCTKSPERGWPPYTHYLLVGYSCLIIGFLIVYQFIFTPASKYRLSPRLQYWTVLLSQPDSQKRIQVFRRVFLTILESLFVVGLGINFANLAWLNEVNQLEEWEFGQIIAVSVWIPSLLESVYLFSSGLEKGSQWRLPRPYRVTSSSYEVGDDSSSEFSSEIGSKMNL